MVRSLVVAGALVLALACDRGGGSSGSSGGASGATGNAGAAARPAGTTSDPVTVCEHFGDVCRLDGSRLGVCSAQKQGPGLVCAPQH